MPYLPVAQPCLDPKPDHTGHHYASAVTYGRRAQRKFSLLLRHSVPNLSEGVDIDEAAQETFPEDDGENDIDRGKEEIKRVEDEDYEIEALEEGWRVEVVDSKERERGAGDEDAELVDCLN